MKKCTELLKDESSQNNYVVLDKEIKSIEKRIKRLNELVELGEGELISTAKRPEELEGKKHELTELRKKLKVEEPVEDERHFSQRSVFDKFIEALKSNDQERIKIELRKHIEKIRIFPDGGIRIQVNPSGLLIGMIPEHWWTLRWTQKDIKVYVKLAKSMGLPDVINRKGKFQSLGVLKRCSGGWI